MKTKTYERMTVTLTKDEAVMLQDFITASKLDRRTYDHADFVQELYDTLAKFSGVS